MVGPNTLTCGQCLASSSTTPSTKGCSGPTTTILACTDWTNSSTVALSMVVSGVVPLLLLPDESISVVALHIFPTPPPSPPSDCVPPFPGRQIIFPTNGELDSATANACSRPPFPNSTTVCKDEDGCVRCCDTADWSRLVRAVMVAADGFFVLVCCCCCCCWVDEADVVTTHDDKYSSVSAAVLPLSRRKEEVLESNVITTTFLCFLGCC